MDKQILHIIADNAVLLDTLKKLFTEEIEKRYTPSMGTTDEFMGQLTRARLFSRDTVDAVFSEIRSYATAQQSENIPNPAR